jgi:hypothetical protein
VIKATETRKAIHHGYPSNLGGRRLFSTDDPLQDINSSLVLKVKDRKGELKRHDLHR